MRWFGICQGQRDVFGHPRQRLIKTNMSTLQCAVKKQSSYICCLRNVQEKAQNMTLTPVELTSNSVN